MNRLIIAISLVVALAFIPPANAQSLSSGKSSSYGGGLQGKITSVTTTNLAVTRTGGHGRHRRRIKSTLVHYNPDSVTITVDGVAVRSLDVAATGKYVSIVGTMKNNILEATSITVSSSAPAHHKKSKSAG